MGTIFCKDDFSRKFKKGEIIPLDHIYAVQGVMPPGSWDHCDEEGNLTGEEGENDVLILFDVNVKCVVTYKRTV
jgi:hypothetical protein